MPARKHCSFAEPAAEWTGALIGAVGSMLIATCQSEARLFAKGNMADLRSFDCALEEALSSLSGHGISLEFRLEQKQAIYTLLSRRDLLFFFPLCHVPYPPLLH